MFLKASKFFLHASVLAVLVVMTTTFFPFIGGKDYYFRFAIELALISFLLWWAFEADFGAVLRKVQGEFRRPVVIAVSLFVLVFILATIFAYDPHAAFWSNFERGDGGFQVLHYYVFFLLLVILFDTQKDWKTIFRVSLATGVLMILYGVLADLGIVKSFVGIYGGAPPAGWWAPLTQGRFQGSLGNPAYVAPYILFSFFYLAYLWASDPKRTWLKHAGYIALAAFFLLFFVLSQTRGALVGLGAAAAAFLIYLAWSFKAWRRWLAPTFIICAIAASLLIYYHDSPFVKKLPGGRIFDISLSDQTVSTRVWTWGSAWQGFLERPVLGWGPENFTAVFDKYFDPRHYVPGEQTETWFDRAHSLYFDALAETGILGFISYFSIFAVLFWQLFRRRASEALSPGFQDDLIRNGIVLALPIGYLVQGLAIFDVLPIYINLFLFFAFAHFHLTHRNA